ncbi:hypothetical protein VCRA217O315_80022 [Vibrio crassostreae]|nr:hypothetical protein VCRA217O315_80022 [Vibrio crassostreae]
MAAFFFGSMLIVVQSLSSPETFLDNNELANLLIYKIKPTIRTVSFWPN